VFAPDRYIAALRFAATRHAAQRVPGTELPYLVHVVSVAAEVTAVLASERLADPELAVTCALLHDTLEDTATAYDELVSQFGVGVADGVRALSKDASLAKDDRMADSLRRIRAQPREIWIVKLADRIVNLAPPPAAWSADKRRAYRDEALQIADALGAASTTLDARLRARAAAYEQYITASSA
jgi:(p)ppGpp synthase/HD superfamily hydrolase